MYMDIEITILFKGEPQLTASAIANQLMSDYFEYNNVKASEALENYEIIEFGESANDNLAHHWQIASDLAFVVGCGGLGAITADYTLDISE